MTVKKVVLTLEASDVAIILKDDGTCDVHVPQGLPRDLPDHVITGAAVMCALQDSRLCDLIHAHFHHECQRRSATENVVNLR